MNNGAEITEERKKAAAKAIKDVPYARLLGFELIDLSANTAKFKTRNARRTASALRSSARRRDGFFD